jgi:hypothetical protein
MFVIGILFPFMGICPLKEVGFTEKNLYNELCKKFSKGSRIFINKRILGNIFEVKKAYSIHYIIFIIKVF